MVIPSPQHIKIERSDIPATYGGNQKYMVDCKWMGNDAIVGNPNSASLRLRGTGKREGGEKTQPFEHL